ncbi:MAG: DUF3857 domain-containing protein [Bacteroidales bacterium]|nr:DUF3857 domain-containing protein [Bacteroidales bacterium]MCF8396813.1 DUF3857 domain-containing protein [Bacteroidales bacterium]
MKKSILLIALALVCLEARLFSQTVSTKWKDVEKIDFELSVEEEYPDAPAVVLFDIGDAVFKVIENEIKLVYNRQVRIRILSKEGYEWADVEIPYYAYQQYEKVNTVNGFTYNIDEKGKISKDKLKNRDIYDENTSEHWNQIKFSMPSVKAGSVIEYEYSIISSDFIAFRDWTFQRSIPVLYSKFTTRIPEYFRYATFYQGMEEMDKKSEESFRDVFTFQKQKHVMNRAEEIAHRNYNVRRGQKSMENNFVKHEYHGTETVYIMENVPPLKDIPFIPTLDDYIAKIKFQLAEQEVPGYVYEKYFTSWDYLCKELMDHEKIGRQLNRNRTVKKQTDDIIAGISDPKEKMKKIYDFVSKAMEWDGSYRYGTYDNLNTAFEERSGNSAEINLILTLMMREAGLVSNPVLISTRSHGKVLKAYPVVENFNHLINYTLIDDTAYLMDATDGDLPYNMLPKNDLNGSGLVLIEGATKWIDLQNPTPNYFKTSLVARFDDDMNLVCDAQSSNGGYYATDKNKAYQKDKETYLSSHYTNKAIDFKTDTFYLNENPDITTEYIKFQSSSLAQTTGDMIYLNPMLFYGLEENKLKREKRKIPVDFNYPFEETYVLNMSIPDGYESLEKPENIKLLLPNGGGEYLYFLVQNGQNLQLVSTLKINKTIYSEEEYPYLKKMFDQIVAKHAEPIVMKKADPSE